MMLREREEINCVEARVARGRTTDLEMEAS